MAYALVNGRRHAVRVTRDLGDNYSVEVYPEPLPGVEKEAEPFKNWPVPLIMKLNAESREDALLAALEHMKKLGRISDFHVDESEKPKPRAGGASAKDEAESEE